MATGPFQRQSGFSLIEMVVALAVVSLVLGVVYEALDGSIRSGDRTESYLKVLTVAQSRLAEASAQRVLKPGTALGTTAGVAWSTAIKTAPGPRPSPETNLYSVSVTASRGGNKVQLNTLVIAGAARE